MTTAKSASSWLKPSLEWLLIFVPIAITLRFIHSLENPTALFICACLAIIPLAGWMGKATEHLAEHLGQRIGGLLNATFGSDGESNWVEGLQLLAVYTILGILFYFLPDAHHAAEALPNAVSHH
ncbi:MAG: hypothetical protein HC846_05055 [Blastocatellia bacterium]|nr:hypothetical protein [Blastocatellia bacterium]